MNKTKPGKIDALARRNINQMEDITVAKKGKSSKEC
jgi:hypothetical protein